MDLGELQTVKDTERGKDSLQHLPDSFYTDVADHIASLKDERKARASEADDPFGDPEIQRLTSEIDSTEQVVESIYERRVGKLVKLASFAAADMPADEEGLTSEERALFSDLVARIKENRGHVLDVLAGEADSEPPEPVADSPSDEPVPTEPADQEPTDVPADTDESSPAVDSTVNAADLMGDGSETEVSSTAGAVTDETGATAGTGALDTGETTESGDRTAAPPEESTDSKPEPTEAERTDDSEGVVRTTLRITRDVGEIVGVDEREYDLATDDIVTLPEANAGALVQREAAERLE